MLSRRRLLQTATVGLFSSPGWAGQKPRFHIGVTDWNLRQSARVEAVSLARSLGFEGVQISLGRKPAADKLPLDDSSLIQQYREAGKANRIALNGTCLDILHVNYLKNDTLAPKWVADGIRLTKALGIQVMLLPFFGKGALATPAEMEYTGDALREVAPQAEKAGVILGLENTISAEDNVRIVERSRSKAVKVYYDIGNSTNNGFDVLKEIRWLGRDRICQIHFKDNPHYLGEGKIDLNAVVGAVTEIGFADWVNLETDSPSKSVEEDMRRNLAYVRKIMATA